MADDKADPAGAPDEPAPRRPAPRPREDSERAIGLEVAKLFGLSPRLLVTRRPQPPDGNGNGDGDGDSPDDGDGGEPTGRG